MLVLTRKSHEQIQIGDNITVTILRVKGGAIRVGIDAPKNVSVLRKELVGKVATGPVVSDESGETETVAPAQRPARDGRARNPKLHAGGKATALPTTPQENPLRASGAAPLGRYLATAGSR